MLINVSHTTEYQYSAPAWLDPHTLRVWPRNNSDQIVKNFSLKIEPDPIHFEVGTDEFGNDTGLAKFETLTNFLNFTVEFEVQTTLTNPFDFEFARFECEQIQTLYSSDERRNLENCLRPTADYSAVLSLANSIGDETNNQTIEFLTLLAIRLREDFDIVVRESGSPYSPEESLAVRRGACRDLAVLYMEACRAKGIAARFVSGYHEGDAEMDRRYLHAWAEVFLPGPGWRGFDPSQGLAVSASHVAVAAGPHSRDAAPITGAYRGDGITSEMHTFIELEVSSNLV